MKDTDNAVNFLYGFRDVASAGLRNIYHLSNYFYDDPSGFLWMNLQIVKIQWTRLAHLLRQCKG